MPRRQEPYRLFKPTYTDRATGKQAPVANWYIEFRDHNRTRHRWPALADERGSRKWAENIIGLVRARQHRERADESLT